ncbi:phage tail tape measure protein [Cupriavidus campinensis]|uniref:Phage tail tape measure protein n=1 Tax=Cupriavidus campinensis TaxID=151783 RepID=A0AAE9L0V9_9BURK|nr:phage tail tape measure protein [Cupriavidus campinensis]URF02966.1 phage tail tape measure protein [Cupriavidus campinensis]
MANDTIVRVTADASGYSAGMDAAKRSLDSFLSSQEAAARRTKAAQDAIAEAAKNGSDASARAINAFVSQTARMADTVGKTKTQLLEQKAAQLGVTDAVSDYITKLKAAEQAASGGRRVQEALDGVGMSARQTANAMRMVPAQMTDIVTQLAGGQSPLLILTQQGGQLRDMFGGFGPAVRAVGTTVVGLINPFTLSAAAAGALAYAMSQGASESKAFNQALIMTGNYAGLSADQLATMSATVSRTIGTQGQAAEVLAKIAATGKIAGDQIVAIGIAAEAMEKATGTAVDKTIEQFVQLGDEPVKASLKLNEQYHYLTAAVYDQIVALEEQGKKDQAAALAQQTYAEQMKSRADKVIGNLGYMERAWNAVTGAAKGAWDAMLGLGRAATLDEIRNKITGVQSQIADLEKGGGFASNEGGAAFGSGARARVAQIQRLREELSKLQSQAKPLEDAGAQATAQAANQRQQDAMISAKARLDAQTKATRSRADQRKDEIDQLKRDAETVGMAADEYNKRVAAIEEKYKDPKTRTAKPKAYQDDAATKFLQQLRDQDAATRAALESSEKLTAAERQQAEFLQKIGDLKGKTILTAEQKSLLANQDQIKAQLAQNVENERALKLKTDITKLEERSAAVNAQIGNYQKSQAEQYQRQLDALGRGSEAQKQAEAVRSIYREYENLQLQLEKATPEAARNSAAYTKAQDDIRAGLDRSLQDYDDYYASLREKQTDWVNGATEAMANYAESSRNAMAQASNTATNAFKRMEDGIVTFATTGKFNFKDFAQSVIADLIRIQARAALSGIISQLGNLVAGYAGGGATVGGVQGSIDSGTAGVSYTTPVDMSSVQGVGFRAAGGPVNAGQPYIVGEMGPEMFVPPASGSIVPNDALNAGAAGGGNVTIVQHNYVDSRSDQASIMQMMVQAKNAAVEEVRKNFRTGGDLKQLAGR